MFVRSMCDLAINIKGDDIWLSQGQEGEETDILIVVDQVDILIKWLQEAKDEIQNASK